MTKLEQVARAIGGVVWQGEVEPRGEWLEAARAAIEALREPTPQMLEDVGTMDNYEGWETADADHIDWWNAMIDAILTEKADG